MMVERLAAALTRTDLVALERLLEGEVLHPGEVEYESSRKLFNGMVDRRPALIVRCASVGDVSLAVTFARKHRIPLSVKGTGHGASGAALCDDGVVLDLSLMSQAEVDEDAGRVRCGPGLTWGQLNDLALAKGLVAAGAAFPSVGVAGSTLGGGTGPLMAKFGLSCDNLLCADVVTAEGEVLRASRDDDRELLWALRGGGTLGAVTAMELRLHPVGEVYGGVVAWPLEQAAEVLKSFRRSAPGMPDELSVDLALVDVPVLGPALGGLVCYIGEAKEAETALEPLFQAGRPEIDGLGPTAYGRLGHAPEGSVPSGLMNHWRTGFAQDLSDEAIGTMLRHFATAPSDLTAIRLWYHHGAMTRVPADATAFPHRRPMFGIHIMSVWRHPLDNARNILWTNALHEDLRPFLTGAAYVNLAGGSERDPRALYGGNLERLMELRDRYDPCGLFGRCRDLRT